MSYSSEFISQIEAIAREAGHALLSHRPSPERAALDITVKSDGSPVTNADLASHNIIIPKLTALVAGETVYSEEAPPSEQVKDDLSGWFVDPLDGTKPFIRGDDHFAVFIGHKVGSQFDFGVMHYPARDLLYTGVAGIGVTLNGAPITIDQGDQIGEGRVACPYSNPPIPEDLKTETEYPTRNLACLDLCAGKLDAVISGYNGFVELWDICAMLGILTAAGLSYVNFNGSDPSFRGRRILTLGMVFGNQKRRERILPFLRSKQ